MEFGAGVSFSWERALGVTKAKHRVSRKTVIPMWHTGRQSKLGKLLGME